MQINDNILIKQGDCLKLMKDIPDKSIDMVLCDLPYGITACKWDTIIPLDKLWDQYNRIIKDTGAICLFGSEPFSTKLRMSNIDKFKYDWYWVKDGSKSISFFGAKNMPLKNVEIISIFSNGIIAHQGSQRRMNYNPQGLIPYGKAVKGDNKGGIKDEHKKNSKSLKRTYVQEFTNYPNQILQFNSDWAVQLHPTQKPVALLEYLIKTYTNENELVLDNCAGSFSTAIACINTGRRFIGYELDEKYFEIGKNRILDHLTKKEEMLF